MDTSILPVFHNPIARPISNNKYYMVWGVLMAVIATEYSASIFHDLTMKRHGNSDRPFISYCLLHSLLTSCNTYPRNTSSPVQACDTVKWSGSASTVLKHKRSIICIYVYIYIYIYNIQMLSELQIYVVEVIPLLCIHSLLPWHCHPGPKYHYRPHATIHRCSHRVLNFLKQSMHICKYIFGYQKSSME